MKRHLNIGFFSSMINNKYEQSITKGIIEASKEIDANVIMFPGRYICDVDKSLKSSEFDYQYNTIFSYADPSILDVLIVSIETIGNTADKQIKLDFLKKFNKIPIVTLNMKDENYSSISVDNVTGLKDGINHIIKEHGKTKIGFVSGSLTNADANERLETYKNTLIENGIPINDNLITYGNFSIRSHKAIEKLLDNNPDIEAIVFANDQMAICGYEIMKNRKIEIGRDILVMGFDNSVEAQYLTPSLTSVECEATNLGYYAVLECENFIKTQKPLHKTVTSSLVIRNSCGCPSRIISSKLLPELAACQLSADLICDILSNYMFGKDRVFKDTEKVAIKYKTFIQKLLKYLELLSGNTELLELHALEKEILVSYETTLDYDFFNATDENIQINILTVIRKHLLSVFKNNEDLLRKTDDIFVDLISIATIQYLKFKDKKYDNTNVLSENVNDIIKKLVCVNENIYLYYKEVLLKISEVNFKSAYIYKYIKSICHFENMDWHTPDKISLVAYMNRDGIFCNCTEEIIMSSKKVLKNEYLPQNERYNLVICPLYTGDYQYGVLVCELDQDYFYLLPSLSSQLSAAMRIASLIENQNKIQHQLERTLEHIKENNNKLDFISKSDELTGIYNRRGFYDITGTAISSIVNEGKNAIFVFADLDSLKQINDVYGHEDGDFAIKSAATILKDCFRASDIVGRIGGDEFAVFAITDMTNCTEYFKSRMENISKAFNSNSGKPYIVHLSAGIYEFKCSACTEISEIVARADSLLYEEKKLKKSIIKERVETKQTK